MSRKARHTHSLSCLKDDGTGKLFCVTDQHKNQRNPDDGSRFLARQFGLKPLEASLLANHPSQTRILERLDAWRQQHGWPDQSSPLSRGMLLDLMKEKV